MSREELLSKLSIRLSHLAETSDADISKQLEALRHSLRDGINEPELKRISERLARYMLLKETAQAKPAAQANKLGAEVAGNIKALQVDKANQTKLAKLADQLQASNQLDEQLRTLNQVFQLLRSTTTATATKKSTSGGLFGWRDKDKKGDADTRELDAFLEKTRHLLNETIRHLDVLNGNRKDTQQLKEQMKQPPSVELLGEIIEDVVDQLQQHSTRIEEERATTQSFLGELRKRLSGVEEAIFSVISDGDESLERAVTLEQQVGEDVREIGQAVLDDDLDVLKQTVETGLSKLAAKVTNYLEVEKESHKESKAKVENLNRKIKAMEDEALELRGQIQDKQDLAVKDSLTGVYNRAGYEQRVTEEIARSKRSKAPLSLVFVDCNKFKQINDTFGHAAGDIVLVKVAAALAARARSSDVIARYGGDEFVAILPDTPATGAEHFAIDACQKILNAGFNANGEPLDVSISCGITEALADDTPETALKRADEAMYLAKKAKGHKVVIL